jgi:type IV pilus assembly protein PilC
MIAKNSHTEKYFIWHGIDRNQINRQGIIKALNIDSAKMFLKNDGITLTKIKKQPLELFPARVKLKDITLFTRQMALMLKAGLPILRAINLAMETLDQKKLSLKKVLLDIYEKLEQGNSLSYSLRQHPKYFNRLYCNLCETGENSGKLAEMFERLAQHQEAINTIRTKLKKAITYPVIVLIVAIGVTWVILNFAIPAFAKVFESSGAPLPKITQITITVSEYVRSYGIFFILALIILTITFYFAKKRFYQFQAFLEYSYLKIPVIGKLIQLSVLARFTRTFEITTCSGMPLTEALLSVATATGNAKYEKATLMIRNLLIEGNSLLFSMAKTKNFPNLLLQMIAVGEETGNLEEMFSNAAQVYEQEADLTTSLLTTALEPILMSVLAVIIGFLIISMYVPLFNFGEAL